MAWLRVERRCVAAAALVLLLACNRDAPDGSGGERGAAGTDSGRALQLADPELFAACDTLEQWVDKVLRGEVARSNGRFTGSARGLTRYGCRLTAADTLAPDVPRPLESVWQALAMRGWTLDNAYMADGPEGSMLGLRSGSLLCVLQHYWEAASDDERATSPDVPFRYDVEVECYREAARPADSG